MEEIFNLMNEQIDRLEKTLIINKRPAKSGKIKMEVKGKLIKKLEVESGISKSEKVWKKQTCIIDTGGEFNNEIAVSAFGDKLEQMNKLEVGMDVSISCNVYSREYKGKYYHNIDGYWFVNTSNVEKVVSTEEDLPF